MSVSTRLRMLLALSFIAVACLANGQSSDPVLEDSQVRPQDSMISVYVPAGEFEMGSDTVEVEQAFESIRFDPMTATPTEVTEYGAKFNQVTTITGANGKEIDVILAWIVGPDGIPKLVTAVPGD